MNAKQNMEQSTQNENEFVNFSILKLSLFNLCLGFGTNLIINTSFIHSWKQILEIAIISMTSGTIIWMSSIRITKSLHKKYPWIEHPAKRVIFTFIYQFLASFGAITIIILADRLILCNFSLPQFIDQLKFIAICCIFFPVIFSLILYSWVFLNNWKAALLREEVLKREQLSLQYESLKTQANPQLLFKSLENLKFLVSKNADEAASYVRKLSNVYRYSLDIKNLELIELDKEIENLTNFLDLMNIQYPALNIQIKINNFQKTFILPQSLQILTEKVLLDNGHVLETINIELKNTESIYIKFSFNGSFTISQVSLNNINERYKSIINSNTIFSQTQESLIVQLPLILEKDEKKQ